MDKLDVDLLKSVSVNIKNIVNLQEYGFHDRHHSYTKDLEDMTLGELILLTNNFTIHKGLRNIGDKKLILLKQIIINTEEYKQMIKQVTKN